MGPTDLTKKNKRRASTSLLLLCLLPAVSFGADVGGGIRVGASYTDNVSLGPSSSAIDDVVYQASPFFNFVHAMPQLDVNADYAFDWYRYSDRNTTSRYHRGEASVTGRAWEDSLTTQLGARRSQALSDPDDVIPSGRLPLSGNLSDQDEWWFSPSLTQTLGSAVTLDASYLYTKVRFDSAAQENTNQNANFGLENYSAGQGLTWALRYDWRRTEYEDSVPWEYQQAKAELGFWVNAKTRVFGAGGKESSSDNPFDPTMEDTFWEAGFAYSPSDNLSAVFAAGERSFGSSWRGSLEYTFRRGSTSLSYSESPTTTGFNRAGRVRNVIDPDDLDDFLDRPGSAERFLTKRLEWDLSLEFRRSSVTLALFDEDRSDRILADGTPADGQHQTGIRMKFSWQAGVRTTIGANGSLINRETGVENKSEFKGVGLNANYRLGSRSGLSLSYKYSEQQPRGDSSSGRNYVANTVSLFYTFSM